MGLINYRLVSRKTTDCIYVRFFCFLPTFFNAGERLCGAFPVPEVLCRLPGDAIS